MIIRAKVGPYITAQNWTDVKRWRTERDLAIKAQRGMWQAYWQQANVTRINKNDLQIMLGEYSQLLKGFSKKHGNGPYAKKRAEKVFNDAIDLYNDSLGKMKIQQM